MEEAKIKRAGNVTLEQKNVLVEVLQQNPQLVSGKFNANFTKRMGQEKWGEITEVLNAIPGASKNWMQWRKTWQDIRTKAKGSKAKLTSELRGTGGGPSMESPLTAFENKVADMIPTTATGGQMQSKESRVGFTLSSTMLNSDGHESDADNEAVIIDYLDDALPHIMPQSENVTDENEVETVEKKKEIVRKTPAGKRRSVTSKRFETTLTQKQEFINVTAAEIDMRKQYYKQKIELLKRTTLAQERMASTKERKCSALERIAAALEASVTN